MKTNETLPRRLESLVNSCVEHGVVKDREEAEQVMYDALSAKRREVLASKTMEGQLSLFANAG